MSLSFRTLEPRRVQLGCRSTRICHAGQRARGDQGSREAGQRLHPDGADFDLGLRDPRGLAQERGFPLIRLDEREADAGGDRQHHARKAGPGAKVDCGRPSRIDEPRELEAVVHVPLVQVWLVGPAHEVDPLVPSPKQRQEL
jgi:hypothetical protein